MVKAISSYDRLMKGDTMKAPELEEAINWKLRIDMGLSTLVIARWEMNRIVDLYNDPVVGGPHECLPNYLRSKVKTALEAKSEHLPTFQHDLNIERNDYQVQYVRLLQRLQQRKAEFQNTKAELQETETDLERFACSVKARCSAARLQARKARRVARTKARK
ncbi:hypothetical protein BT63DRAFT_272689 [Microthyrium microscopicum]|uniref:Uncharacterized protein n=1 Tax=Microthyrium microscopicum TaxID=703497 RepID=A0A6A6U7Q5_9PEZI|nr:hypothetical protein BT63DRAFT_272689 [Microthyrium microscopicum]